MVESISKNTKEVKAFFDIKENVKQCLVCPNKCILREGQTGSCFVRSNENNSIILKEYGNLAAISVDPIEKKPLYHYKPGHKTLSFGGFGCSMRCDYCENYKISQNNIKKDTKYFSPEELCSLASKKMCKILCFTYNEPIVYFEYLLDVARCCFINDLDIIIKTNGYAEKDIWQEVCHNINAMNIDWKGSGENYKKVTCAKKDVTLNNVYEAVNSGVHVEISVPVYYDSCLDDYKILIESLRNIDKNIPIHLLKIFPSNKISFINLTSDFLIEKVYDYMKSEMNYVYIFGSSKDNYKDTFCCSCKNKIVSRNSFNVILNERCCNDCPKM